MKKLMTGLMMIASLLVSGVAHAEVLLGKDYSLVNPPQPAPKDKIEVLEFFFYECPHCFHLHPHIAKWEKTKASDVTITYVPTIFRPGNEPLATTYYALEAMGKIKKMDDEIYQAVHVKQENLYDLNSIGEFVGKYGVDRKAFEIAYSFDAPSKIKLAKQMIRTYNIEGTPTLVVDGKYAISGLQPEDTIRVLNEVIEKVRKEHAPVGKKH
ncbi:MAG: thiol:disulfide interchange protein DsbA/DsbL [Gallionella sp.]